MVAKSFGCIFYRNALNVELHAVKCSGIVKEVQQGSLIQINLKDGLIPYLKKFGKYSHLKNI